MKLKNILCMIIGTTEKETFVYDIPLLQYYIKMTIKKFKASFKEYKANIKYNKRTTAFAILYNTGSLQIIFIKSKIYCPSRFYFTSIILESIEIYMHSQSIYSLLSLNQNPLSCLKFGVR